MCIYIYLHTCVYIYIYISNLYIYIYTHTHCIRYIHRGMPYPENRVIVWAILFLLEALPISWVTWEFCPSNSSGDISGAIGGLDVSLPRETCATLKQKTHVPGVSNFDNCIWLHLIDPQIGWLDPRNGKIYGYLMPLSGNHAQLFSDFSRQEQRISPGTGLCHWTNHHTHQRS